MVSIVARRSAFWPSMSSARSPHTTTTRPSPWAGCGGGGGGGWLVWVETGRDRDDGAGGRGSCRLRFGGRRGGKANQSPCPQPTHTLASKHIHAHAPFFPRTLATAHGCLPPLVVWGRQVSIERSELDRAWLGAGSRGVSSWRWIGWATRRGGGCVYGSTPTHTDTRTKHTYTRARSPCTAGDGLTRGPPQPPSWVWVGQATSERPTLGVVSGSRWSPEEIGGGRGGRWIWAGRAGAGGAGWSKPSSNYHVCVPRTIDQ